MEWTFATQRLLEQETTRLLALLLGARTLLGLLGAPVLPQRSVLGHGVIDREVSDVLVQVGWSRVHRHPALSEEPLRWSGSKYCKNINTL